MASAFDYEPGQRVRAQVFGGWKHVTVEQVIDASTVRVTHQQGAMQRAVTIYDLRLIEPCPTKKKPLTCPEQPLLDL